MRQAPAPAGPGPTHLGSRPLLRGQGESARPPAVRAPAGAGLSPRRAGRGRAVVSCKEAGPLLALADLGSPLNTGELSGPPPYPAAWSSPLGFVQTQGLLGHQAGRAHRVPS